MKISAYTGKPLKEKRVPLNERGGYTPGSKEYRKETYLCNLYGITLKQFNNMFEEQKGCCAICGVHQLELSSSLCVDHCHTTLKVRGLLCAHCNHAIGKFRDDIGILENAIKYLKK